ncbi:MAG: MFS transporter [Dehalococcoidia bacterium]|nr:MFS transporter [Dehalococcoidia bacterium]
MGAGPGRGWLIVAVVFLGAGLTVGSSNYAFGLFVEPLENEFGWRRTYISASLSFMALGSLFGPLIGRLMDRHGARPVMVASLVVLAVSFALRPLMTDLWHWYVLSALQFLAFYGAAILPAGRLVGLWFPRTRGRAMAAATMGNNFGGLLVPPLVAVAIGADGSWQTAYLGLGLAALALAIAAALVVTEPGSGKASSRARGTLDRRVESSVGIGGWTPRQAMRSRAFFAVALAIMLGNFTYTIILGHVFAHMEVREISGTTAALAVSVLAACGMAGKLVLGYLTERVPARFVMMVAFGGQIIGIIMMLTLLSGATIWLAVGLFGFFMGSFGTLSPLQVQDTFGIRSFGTIMGLVSATTVISFGLGPLIAGLSYDLSGGYGPAFIAAAMMFGLALVVLTQASASPPPDSRRSSIVGAREDPR